jgi:hypothetical protein
MRLPRCSVEDKNLVVRFGIRDPYHELTNLEQRE